MDRYSEKELEAAINLLDVNLYVSDKSPLGLENNMFLWPREQLFEQIETDIELISKKFTKLLDAKFKRPEDMDSRHYHIYHTRTLKSIENDLPHIVKMCRIHDHRFNSVMMQTFTEDIRDFNQVLHDTPDGPFSTGWKQNMRIRGINV